MPAGLEPGGQTKSSHVVTERDLVEMCRQVKKMHDCIEKLDMNGCPDEKKTALQTLQSGVTSARGSLCDPNTHEAFIALSKCQDQKIMQDCALVSLADIMRSAQGGSRYSEKDLACREFGVAYKCEMESSRGCPPAAQPGLDATREFYDVLLQVQNCRPLGNAASFSGPWISTLTLAALCSTLLLRLR